MSLFLKLLIFIFIHSYMLLIYSLVRSQVANFQQKIHCKWKILILLKLGIYDRSTISYSKIARTSRVDKQKNKLQRFQLHIHVVAICCCFWPFNMSWQQEADATLASLSRIHVSNLKNNSIFGILEPRWIDLI